jgi:hypothetical protein
MAKKKTASGFNMAAEVRNLLTEDRTLSGRQVYETLKKKFPKQSINESSCGVAFSAARKKLGISKGRGKKKARKSNGTVAATKKSTATQAADLTTLQLATKFVSEVGDTEKAITAIRQLRSLQIQ